MGPTLLLTREHLHIWRKARCRAISHPREGCELAQPCTPPDHPLLVPGPLLLGPPPVATQVTGGVRASNSVPGTTQGVWGSPKEVSRGGRTSPTSCLWWWQKQEEK